MFDKSLLPEARLEFVVISDSHYMRDPGAAAAEFENRRKQAVRRQAALLMVSALQPAFVVHNGDMAQECPDHGEKFRVAMAEAVEQMTQCGISPHYVAGNQDVGDKPDPTSATAPVTPQVLDWYHREFGPSWYSFDHDGCHFLALNSQVMNTDLPEAGRQQAWAEADLAANQGKRHFVFLHLPPYLLREDEASLGHYNNLAEPARGWLLRLLREHQAEVLFAGHVHFAFFDRVGATRYYVLSSPAFTRPGFPYLFPGPPPPQRGRDDRAKLGFYLVRVRAEKTDVHFIRTAGAEDSREGLAAGESRLITPLSGACPRSGLGVTLQGRLATYAEIPRAWPSAAKETVRNDYPLLACLELGVRHLRAALEDFDDPLQRQRLEIVRDEGISLTGYTLVAGGVEPADLARRHRGRLDGIELQLPGHGLPDWERLLSRTGRLAPDVPITLVPIMTREPIAGKHLTRLRYGARISEVDSINQLLARRKMSVDRLICQLESGRPIRDQFDELSGRLPFGRIGAIDFSVDFNSVDDSGNSRLAAEALFWAAAFRQRVYFEPLLDLDRTMDIGHGLLDHLCNPRPAARILRSLNGILGEVMTGGIDPSSSAFALTAGLRFSQISTAATTYSLVCLGNHAGRTAPEIVQGLFPATTADPSARVYRLGENAVRPVRAPDIPDALAAALASGPALVVQGRRHD